MIVFGTRLFGYVDEVDGLGSVATRFVHVMWFPLIPIGGVFVMDGDRGYSIPMSPRSIVVAWVRALLFWGALASVVAVPATFGATLCTAVPLGLAWLGMPLLVRKASAARAAELRAQYG